MKNFKLGGRYAIATFIIMVLFTTTQSALAMCVWGIVPPERIFQPIDATEAFLAYDDGVQTVVMRPEFKGNATDLSLIHISEPTRPY